MALIPCPSCGLKVSNMAAKCPHCGKPILGDKVSDSNPNGMSQSPVTSGTPTSSPVSASTPEPRNHTWIIIVAIAALLLAASGVGGWFYYKNIYLPRKIDAEAPRYYTFVRILYLRSSQVAGVDHNKLADLPYGTELITYDHGLDWSHVKVKLDNNSYSNGHDKNEIIGYVSSAFILDKHDFALLNSIFGDTESKSVISSAKCRIALLNYFKDNGYIGQISDEERMAADIYTTPDDYNQWQVFSKDKNAKHNTTYFKRIVNPESKFTDFAVIIKNIVTGDRKLLYFSFDDDETPHLIFENNAPREGYIEKIQKSPHGEYMNIYYTD